MPTPYQITHAIAAIENPYPPDDFIKTYKDFLRVRDVLTYYQYNPKVLASLADMLDSLWYSKERISRISLLTSIKQYGVRVKAVREYYGRTKGLLHPFPVETNRKICRAFQRCFDSELPISRKQAENIKVLCNSLLIGAPLGAEEEQWLCSNADESPMILNRLLRYPVASPVISAWAGLQYYSHRYSERRTEMVGWMLDENPDFEIDEQTLIADFEYLNRKDKAAVRQFDEEWEAKEIMDNELGPLLLDPNKRSPDLFGFGSPPPSYYSDEPKLELSKRPYRIPTLSTDYSKYKTSLPDFNKLTTEFYRDLLLLQNKTMLWAITYSRLPLPVKEELLIKNYEESSANSFFTICKRLKSVNLLQWLKEQG
mgnify:CR=1 FL=1